MTYKQLDRKASAVMTKLQNEISKGKVYENQGQKELRQFEDLINASDLMFQEKLQLKTMLSQAIDGLW